MKSYPETIKFNKMPSQEERPICERFIEKIINEHIKNFDDAKKKQAYEALSLLVICTGTDIEKLKTHLRSLNLVTLCEVITNRFHKQAIVNYIAKTAQDDFKYDLETKIISFSIRQLLGYGYWLKLNCKGVTSINLSKNYLDCLTPEHWTAFFAGLKASPVKKLDLSKNGLDELTPEHWTVFFAGLKESPVKKLDLSKNDLDELTPAQWTAFLAGLKESSVTTLDLSKNDLYELTPAQWTAFFATLKKSPVTSLNLSKNRLYNLTPAQWTAFLEGIRNSPLITINLKNNEFSEERKIQLRPLLMADCHNKESDGKKGESQQNKRIPSLKTLTTLLVFGDPERRAEAFKICGKELITASEQSLAAVNKRL